MDAPPEQIGQPAPEAPTKARALAGEDEELAALKGGFDGIEDRVRFKVLNLIEKLRPHRVPGLIEQGVRTGGGQTQAKRTPRLRFS